MRFTLFILFAVFSIRCSAQDMQKYLSETREMVGQKKYKEALERYVWFQDHALEYNKAMSGVRLSFALSNWKSLADIYPPAMTAIKEMRDKKTRVILDSNASSRLFADVAALNRTLNEPEQTIELFQNIEKHHPDQSKASWYWAKEALFGAKRYDIIRKYIGNPVNEFVLLKSQYEMMTSRPEGDQLQRPEFKVYYENYLVERSLELIQYSIAIKDVKSAAEIQDKALGIVTDIRLRDFKFDHGN